MTPASVHFILDCLRGGNLREVRVALLRGSPEDALPTQRRPLPVPPRGSQPEGGGATQGSALPLSPLQVGSGSGK